MFQSFDEVITELREEGIEFPATRRTLIQISGVGEGFFRECARRGLLLCSEAWDGSLSPRTAQALEEHGITSREEFRRKYAAGELQIHHWRGVGKSSIVRLLAWAGLTLPDDGKLEVKLNLSKATRDGLDALRKRLCLASRDAVVERLVEEAR